MNVDSYLPPCNVIDFVLVAPRSVPCVVVDVHASPKWRRFPADSCILYGVYAGEDGSVV